MKITLKNIGIVRESTISLDGLTVITGKNNSGKTTVGKALYSLLDGTRNIEDRARADRARYMLTQVIKVGDMLEFLRFFRDEDGKIRNTYPSSITIRNLWAHRFMAAGGMRDLNTQCIRDLIEQLEEFDFTVIENSLEFQGYRHAIQEKSEEKAAGLLKGYHQQRDKAVEILRQLLVDMEKDPELTEYIRKNMDETLRVEFSNQIQPIKGQTGPSEIMLFDEKQTYFQVTIADNHIVDEGLPVGSLSPCEKVYLVDDPFILDGISSRTLYGMRMVYGYEPVYDAGDILNHNQKLKAVLRSPKTQSVFEQMVAEDTRKSIQEKMNAVIPGAIDVSAEGTFYVENGKKLEASNLATGSKMFSIIKTLLEKGELDRSTMLILDEPEAHLHPKWQNAFAEIIVLLVKELKVNILLTTHSPNFMLALDAYMRKYAINEQTNFYQTDLLEDGFVRYHCANEDMGQIYQDFLQYLSEVKSLRNQYI